MTKYFVGLIMLLCNTLTFAQNTFEATIKDEHSNESLIGVNAYIKEIQIGGTSDVNGVLIIQNIPNGNFTIEISYIGYEKRTIQVQFPQPESGEKKVIFLEPSHEHMDEVVVKSTRSSRTIDDNPTRIEVIAGEELAEKGNMKPGDIRMLLNESTGIQTQQTSATSYNSSIRIQGLDGKYTQLLRDGMPLYSGYSGGLSLMQIAPLDLKQVEVIKGASSTLYGGGAIAGLVNLISKTPEEDPELKFMFNGTSALGLDASGFYAQKKGKIGTTVFASYNRGTAYDPADIGLTAIPQFDRYTLNPKLFLYPTEQSQVKIGVNYIHENRLGGNMDFINDEEVNNPYFERNQTDRVSSQVQWNQELRGNTSIEVKNSVNYYDRIINIPDFTFAGTQISSFSEVNLSTFNKKSAWIIGLNLWTDDFNQSEGTAGLDLGYENYTFGGFIQNTWNVSNSWTLESGLRTDYHSDYGFIPLPRVSVMYEPTEKLTFRLGGGMGYKSPTVFSEDAERMQFQNIQPINPDEMNNELSYGGNFDVNFKIPITDELSLNTNTLLFYTQIQDPLVLMYNGTSYQYFQPDGFIDTKGVEVNMKWAFHDFKLFVGYTYSDVIEHYDNETSPFPLVANHRLNNVLMYEKHENFWIGLEAYYYSPQKLNDGTTGQDYWIVGLMTEKTLGKHFSVFLNFENFLDTRQSKFDMIYTGNISDPNFKDIYAPVDGFVVNGGVKISLL